jgi:hypothetical protein
VSDGQGARGAHEPWEFEVFPTGTTIARAPDDIDEAFEFGARERLRRGSAAVRDGYEHARDFHARPGHRPGGTTAPVTSGRDGGDTDIVRPVLVDPLIACQLAVSGQLFAEPIDHLDIEHHSQDPDEARYLVWRASLTSDHGRPVPATLHLLASPSMVVTVLELVPRRRLRWNRDRFVRDGVAAIEVLAHRLERAQPRRAA